MATTRKDPTAPDAPDVEELKTLLHIAGWYVYYFWEETKDPAHRAKAWEHMQQIEAATGKRI